MWTNQYGQERAESMKSDLWAKETGVVVDTAIRLSMPTENLILTTPPKRPRAGVDGPKDAARQSLTVPLRVLPHDRRATNGRWCPQSGRREMDTP
jgi:hypothetical protein